MCGRIQVFFDVKLGYLGAYVNDGLTRWAHTTKRRSERPATSVVSEHFCKVPRDVLHRKPYFVFCFGVSFSLAEQLYTTHDRNASLEDGCGFASRCVSVA